MRILLIILLGSSLARAQQTELSVSYGYGAWNTNHADFNVLPKYGGLNPVYHDAGIGVKHFPASWKYFSLTTGIDFGFRQSYFTAHTRYIRIPGTVDFTIGKRVRLTLSTGIYASVLYQYILVNQNDDIQNTVNRFQIGNKTAIGGSVTLGKHFAIGLFYQRNTDFVRYYTQILGSWAGASYRQNERGHDNFIKLAITYSLKPWSEYYQKVRRNEDQ